MALFSAIERHAEVSELQRQSTERFNVTSRKAHLLPEKTTYYVDALCRRSSNAR